MRKTVRIRSVFRSDPRSHGPADDDAGPMTASPPADRHALILPALCWGPQHSDFYAVTEDITAQGIGLRSSVVPEIGERLALRVQMNSPVLRLFQRQLSPPVRWSSIG